MTQSNKQKDELACRILAGIVSILFLIAGFRVFFGGVNLLHAATISDRLQSARVDDKVIAARVETVQKYIASLNTADINQIVSLFSDDAVAIDPLGSTPVVGIAKIRDFYKKGPFLHSIRARLDGEVRVSGNSAAFAFIAFSGGKKMQIIDVFEFNNEGKIVKMMAYWSHKNVSDEVEK